MPGIMIIIAIHEQRCISISKSPDAHRHRGICLHTIDV